MELIPEIELLIGKQPAPPVLGPEETLNRFRLILRNFVGAVASAQPLVIFLDDLQWAGSATLNLLEPLLADPAINHLLIVGSYRDNEVDSAHPLTGTLAKLEAAGVRLRRVILGPLALPELTELLSDTLRSDRQEAEPLARLVLGKTGGNPFFVIQFLQALGHAGLVAYDYDQRHWTFDMEAIAEAGLTDNVIDLMARKIRRLSPKAAHALTLGACIGNQFDGNTLAVVSEQSPEETEADLREALDEGLILSTAPSGEPASYAFLHDRVQQAAYALIPADRRQLVHLSLGRLLLRDQEASSAEGRIFDVVHHLNLGRALVASQAERRKLVQLDLNAGRRAKSSTAYQAALEYFKSALEVLTPDWWDSDYDLICALHLEGAECEYLAGDETEAERLLGTVLQRAHTRVDQVRAHRLRIVHYEYLSHYADAIAVGREALRLFDLSFPEMAADKARAFEREVAAIDALIGSQPIEALVDLPVLADAEIKALLQLLSCLHTPCYLVGDKTLTLLNAARMVRLSLAHGNTEESALAYVLYAMDIGPIRGNHATAYEFGTLALRVNERFPDRGLRAKVLMNFSWAVSIWRRPIQESFQYTREAFRLGNETGLFSDASYALFNETYFCLLSGAELAGVRALCDVAAEYMRRVKMERFVDAPLIIRQWALALQGHTETPTSLTGADFDEVTYRSAHQNEPLFQMFFLVAKLALHCTFGEYKAACSVAGEAEAVIQDYGGTIWDELTVFYHALALAALHRETSNSDRAGVEAVLDHLNSRLAAWAQDSPANFRAQHLLISAEISRIRGHDGEAMALYEEAIQAGALQTCPHDRGLTQERYADFWRHRGQPKVAAVFLAEARFSWLRWGAVAKARALELEVGDLHGWAESPQSLSHSGPIYPEQWRPAGSTNAAALDFVSVMKAAQAIAGEIELERLLDSLLRIVLENAGAERGSLLLERDGDAWVQAEGTVEAVDVRVAGGTPLAKAERVPQRLVNYVRRSGESVVLTDARSDERYAADPYVQRWQPRSVLCTPVLNQGRAVGVLYLEDNLAVGTFTPERIRVIQVLTSQAAVAIENAKLFGEVARLRDRLQAENVFLKEEVKQQHGFEEIVGRSAPLSRVLRQVEQVAPTDTTVLITGETGTGKELIARAIHNLSSRKGRPLVTVNCGAISAGLVESELFGHEKGAFTGAFARKVGRFELANEGTVFLDEIGDLLLDLQVKLLRVLQEGEIERVGGTQKITVNVRIVAATHRALEDAVAAGGFREDLYYRLNVFPIHAPSLRERKEDVPRLVRYFVMKYSAKMGKRIESVPQATLDALTAYPWPGNVRELANVIERSVIVSRGSVLELGEWIAPGRATPQPAASRTLDNAARQHILEALEHTGWRVSGPRGAARLLGIKPTTLEARMAKLGISRPK